MLYPPIGGYSFFGMIMIMTRHYSRLRDFTIRFFRTLAYISLTFQWLWLILIALPPLISSQAFEALIVAPPEAVEPVRGGVTAPSPATWIFVGVVTIIVLAVTVIILIRLPRKVLSLGEHTVNRASTAVVPLILHHQPIAPKTRRIITRRVRLALQLFAVIIPVCASPFLPEFKQLNPVIIMTTASVLGTFSAICFVTAWMIEPESRPTSRTRSLSSRGSR